MILIHKIHSKPYLCFFTPIVNIFVFEEMSLLLRPDAEIAKQMQTIHPQCNI